VSSIAGLTDRRTVAAYVHVNTTRLSGPELHHPTGRHPNAKGLVPSRKGPLTFYHVVGGQALNWRPPGHQQPDSRLRRPAPSPLQHEFSGPRPRRAAASQVVPLAPVTHVAHLSLCETPVVVAVLGIPWGGPASSRCARHDRPELLPEGKCTRPVDIRGRVAPTMQVRDGGRVGQAGAPDAWCGRRVVREVAGCAGGRIAGPESRAERHRCGAP
jgi:hypothetical protein